MSLNLFDLPNVDYRYEASREVRFRPALTGLNPISFNIPASEDFYDLGEAKLIIECRLTHPSTGYTGIEVQASGARSASDGNDTRNMAIQNNFAHTIFRQMDLKFNQVLMTQQTNQYHQDAYLKTLLNFSQEEGKTKLAAQGWVNQVNPTAELIAAAANSDKLTEAEGKGAFEALEEITKPLQLKRWATFVVKPNLTAFQTGKALVPGVQIDLDCYLNSNLIYLYGTPNKGTLTDKKFPYFTASDFKVELSMRKLTLNSSIYVKLAKERQLSKQAVPYPVVRSELRTLSIPSGSTFWEQDNIFLNRLPDRNIVALVHTDGFNGKINRSCFAYEKFKLAEIIQTVEGEEYPYKTLKLSNVNDQESGTDLLGYDRFLTASEGYYKDGSPMVQPGDWGHGKNCTLFMFNNVPSGKADNAEYRNPRQSGNVRLQLLFSAATTNNITVMVWSEYENVFEINNLGGVKYNILD